MTRDRAVSQPPISFDDRSRRLGCNRCDLNKPRLWRKKNKCDDQQAQNIVLPGAPVIVPVDDTFH